MKEFLLNHQFITYLGIIFLATIISIIVIPSIIHVSKIRHLFDDMETERKHHLESIPRLGGVAIFCSFTIVSLTFLSYSAVLPANFLITSCIILFALGLKDDLAGVNSSTKFSVQFVAAAVIVLLGGVSLTSLYGIFNVYEISYPLSAILSITTIVLCINAFNLIDGIDGLAGTIGVVVNATFGILFFYMGQFEIACLAFSLVGAILGFLVYNYSPAKIFMGDTGSFLIGLISIVLAIKFIELNKFLPTSSLPRPLFYSAPSIAIAILIIPIFDTLRIFIVRLLKGNSPFVADRNHIHHRLLLLGLNHMQATLILMLINFFFIYLALQLRLKGNVSLITLFTALSMIFNYIITLLISQHKAKSKANKNLN
ncbi:MAG: undecaprenyl/decaprenyl-phosphate alpha-N-acetylglucosaminyl 1-phosphate transferase [Sphingobacteriales bacterium]|nr:MAG: undecaprenyl/decaprenyl-phosphate alpha-N-acetylglucosaminyl 1-phosphate transferase [Sphingobacteriales bacterium]